MKSHVNASYVIVCLNNLNFYFLTRIMRSRTRVGMTKNRLVWRNRSEHVCINTRAGIVCQVNACTSGAKQYTNSDFNSQRRPVNSREQYKFQSIMLPEAATSALPDYKLNALVCLRNLSPGLLSLSLVPRFIRSNLINKTTKLLLSTKLLYPHNNWNALAAAVVD